MVSAPILWIVWKYLTGFSWELLSGVVYSHLTYLLFLIIDTLMFEFLIDFPFVPFSTSVALKLALCKLYFRTKLEIGLSVKILVSTF